MVTEMSSLKKKQQNQQLDWSGHISDTAQISWAVE